MSALLFPGQGSQVVGMGSEFFKNFDLVKKISLDNSIIRHLIVKYKKLDVENEFFKKNK